MYNINELKDLGIKPTYFGLGMIQMNMSPTERLNFYHPDLMLTVNPDDEYHDHRYDFFSRVLIGELHQTFVSFEPNWDNYTHSMKYVSCSKDKPAPIDVRYGNIEEYYTSVNVAGSNYAINKNVLHSVSIGDKPCLTKIFRPAKAAKEFAAVVAPIEYETTCPFASDLTVNERWDIIAEVLKKG